MDSLINAALVPVIIGLVELAKNLGLPARYAGLLAVALGLLLVFVWTYLSGQARDVILIGLGTGLAASGLYSAGKAVLNG